ncbi:MAG: hypothetical protein V4702_03360 [Patescibacteria group bacterium]
MSHDDQENRDKFYTMSREELAEYVGTDDPSLSREELIMMAMEMDSSDKNRI